MGSFIGGLLGAVGKNIQAENSVNAAYQHQANEEMASTLDHLADIARDPIHAQEYRTLALKYRALPMGKKPGKDMDLGNVMYKQVQGANAPGQVPSLPAPPTAATSTTSAPTPPPTQSGPASNPGPSLSQLPPEWSDTAHANTALPPPPGMGSTDAGAVALDQSAVGGPSVIGPPQPPPQAQVQAPMPQAQSPVQSRNIPVGAALPPPPTSAPIQAPSGQPNMPGGGMADTGNPNIVAGGTAPSTGFGLPANTGYFRGDDGNLYRSSSFLPRELTQMQIAAEEAKQRGINQAELERMESLSEFNRQQNMKLLDKFKSLGIRHVKWSIGTNGQPAFQPDMGKTVPGLVQGAEAESDATDLKGKPLDPNKFYRVKDYSDGTREYIPELGVTTKLVMPDQNSPTGFSVVYSDRAGRPVATQIGATPPGQFAPEVVSTNGNRQQVVDFGDHKEIVNVGHNNTTTRQRVVPGVTVGTTPPTFAGSPKSKVTSRNIGVGAALPPPPGSQGGQGSQGSMGRVIGDKGLQPNQAMTAKGKLGALDNTADLVQDVQKDLPILNSLIDAKKIELQIDPKQGFVTAMINRNVPLTPAEARMAGNFQSLMEHINTLRGPLGATGFRGPEAFAALQNQRGNLSANPAVTRQVLANTMRALDAQRDALNYGLSRGSGGKGNKGTALSAPPTSGMVMMKAPTGQTQPVPADQVEHYKSLGATVVTK